MRQWDLRLFAPEGAPAVPEAKPDDVPHDLVAQVPGIVWTTDLVLQFTSLGGGSLAELKLGPNQLVGLTLFELFDTDDPRAPVVAAHLRAIAGDAVSFDVRVADRLFHGRVAPLEDTGGEQIGTICVLLEATGARKRVDVGRSSTLVTVG
jgi:hypothetical protein